MRFRLQHRKRRSQFRSKERRCQCNIFIRAPTKNNSGWWNHYVTCYPAIVANKPFFPFFPFSIPFAVKVWNIWLLYLKLNSWSLALKKNVRHKTIRTGSKVELSVTSTGAEVIALAFSLACGSLNVGVTPRSAFALVGLISSIPCRGKMSLLEISSVSEIDVIFVDPVSTSLRFKACPGDLKTQKRSREHEGIF